MISPGSRIAHFLDDSTYGLAFGDIFLADRQIDIIARHRIIFLLKQQSRVQLQRMRLVVSDVNMVLVGDTFVGRPDPDSAFATVRHLLKDVDIAFCNLETVVADAKYLAPHDHDHHPRTDEWIFDSYVQDRKSTRLNSSHLGI